MFNLQSTERKADDSNDIDDIDGIPVEDSDIDGIPIDTIDGTPFESTSNITIKFKPSKWETVDPDLEESQSSLHGLDSVNRRKRLKLSTKPYNLDNCRS